MYNGVGTLTLGGASPTFNGKLTVLNGTLSVGADFPAATAIAQGIGTLAGTGKLLSVQSGGGGTVQPAGAGAGGTLTVGNSALATGTFVADLAVRNPSDRLALAPNATLNVDNTTLVVNGVDGTFADVYPILTSPTGGLSGRFTGLADGSTFTAGGTTFRIDYAAKVVTLTNLGTVAARTLHWTGQSGSAWSSPANWQEGRAPVNGDTLVFDTATVGFSPATPGAFAPSNDLVGLTGLAIRINDQSTAGDFVLGGNPVGLLGGQAVGIASTVTAGVSATVNNALALSADTAFAAQDGVLNLGAGISGPFALVALTAPGATLGINAPTSYAGGTFVPSGTLAVGASAALGTGAVTLSGGTLSNSSPFLQLPNPFVVAAPSAIGGAAFFELDGAGTLNADLRLINTSSVTLAGALAGPGGLTVNTFPGKAILGGPASNSYTGPTTVQSGTLTLQKTNGATAVASPITIAGGSFPTLTLAAANQLNGKAAVTVGVNGIFNTAGFAETTGGLAGVGTVSTGLAAGGVLSVLGGNSLFSGTLVGANNLAYNGPGTLTLGGASPAYNGLLGVGNGARLQVSADFSAATAAAFGTGVLGGTGLLRSLNVAGSGIINPGTLGGPGRTLSTAAGVVVAPPVGPAGQTLAVDLDDSGPSDQLVIGNGSTFDLASVNLVVNSVASSVTGTVFRVVASPTGNLTGQFVGLPNNAQILAGGRLFRINYTPTATLLTDIQSVTLTPGALGDAEVGIPYNQSIAASGGTGTVVLTLSNVNNLVGLNVAVNPDGLGVTVSGTPTAVGTLTFTVTPNDVNGQQGATNYAITVRPAVVLTPQALPPADVGTAYVQTITSTGGTPPTPGTPPTSTVNLFVSNVVNASGITITGNGTPTITLMGTPTTAGPVTFTVTPVDGVGVGQPVNYTLAVSNPPTLTPAALPDGEAGVAYNQAITPVGGSAPVVLVVSNVVNPTGLAITGSGTGTVALTGAPTAAGTVSFTVTPIDAVGPGTPVNYSLVINPRRRADARRAAADHHRRAVQPDHHRLGRRRHGHARGRQRRQPRGADVHRQRHGRNHDQRHADDAGHRDVHGHAGGRDRHRHPGQLRHPRQPAGRGRPHGVAGGRGPHPVQPGHHRDRRRADANPDAVERRQHDGPDDRRRRLDPDYRHRHADRDRDGDVHGHAVGPVRPRHPGQLRHPRRPGGAGRARRPAGHRGGRRLLPDAHPPRRLRPRLR